MSAQEVCGTTEEWRLIPGLDGYYEASSRGNVRSWRGHRGRRLLRSRPIGGFLSEGYPTAHLVPWGPTRIHVLVALAFLGGRTSPEHVQVAHRDGNPLNNRVENLRWSTRSENMMDRIEHGTANSGERNGGAKLTQIEVSEIRTLLAAGESLRSIAIRFGVHKTSIDNIMKGKTWRS